MSNENLGFNPTLPCQEHDTEKVSRAYKCDKCGWRVPSDKKVKPPKEGTL